ncbi:hypothetical protein TRVA0_003S04676 [Trichomonascus vanleenenianus]|uniref:uncharacterized protein n=1 Tax=Trichomonascus vanleenenianus TaxID=2268995 RepID=UPI003ECB9142
MSAAKLDHLKGPVVLISTSFDEKMAISADTDGDVFVSKDIDATHEEPNDVRQVFILRSLNFSTEDLRAGFKSTEERTKYALKSPNKTFLSVSKYGTASCKATAIGQNETFTLVPYPDGWKLKTSFGTCLSVIKEGKDRFNVKGTDEDSENGSSLFTLKVQIKHAKGESDEPKIDITNISSSELERRAGRKLSYDEKKLLKRAYRDGTLNEALLDLRQKSSHDTRC